VTQQYFIPEYRRCQIDCLDRTGDAKLILNLRTRQEELYDLALDPGEQHNVDASEAKAAAPLREMLDRWRSSATAASLEPGLGSAAVVVSVFPS